MSSQTTPPLPGEGESRPTAPWGLHPVPSSDRTRLELGPVSLWVSGHANELRLAASYASPREHAARAEAELSVDAAAPEPDEGQLEWQRWAFEGAIHRIRIRPALPDRPLVLDAEEPLRLRPGAEVRIYVEVPAWVSVVPEERDRAAAEPSQAVAEFPSVVLSSTWFGDFFDGELGFWIPTRARRQASRAPRGSHLVICPIQIQNLSGEDLAVEKVCLRAQFVSIFSDGDRLWGDETRISYRGAGDFSRIRWSGKPPKEAPAATLLSPPRQTVAAGIKAWTFAQISDLSGLGRQV